MALLENYEKESGQLINKAKSCFIVGSKTSTFRSNTIAAITGFQKKNLPFKYLGCTLFKGIKKVDYFSEMLAKFEKKLAGWKSKLLSEGGTIILIKHVLQSLPLYNMAAFDPP